VCRARIAALVGAGCFRRVVVGCSGRKGCPPSLSVVIYKSITGSRFVGCLLMDMALMCASVTELAGLKLLSEDPSKCTAKSVLVKNL
jgi:hypothetical protein